MVEFKDVYITAKDGKIQWPILDIERITFDETSLTGIQFKEAVQMWMNRAPTNGPVWDNLNAALAEKDAEIARLKNQCNDKDHVLQDRWNRIEVNEKRIADLEKLSTMQKATIDARGKELEGLKTKIKLREEKDRADFEFAIIQSILHNGDTPGKAEPGLFICPAHGVSEMCPTCHHSKPHEHTGETCNFDGVRCKKCIPYKEPAQTPAPEEGRSPIQHLQDRVLEMEQHQGRDRADLMEKIRVLESQAHVMYCCNDDAAKGVGVLTSRVDKMEKDAEILKDSFVTPHGIDIANTITRVSRLETALEDASRGRIDILDSDLAAVMRAALKQKDQIKGLEHRLGLAQDRIAEIHPSGCVPPAKSKPKSRLKTDRVKKVKDS